MTDLHEIEITALSVTAGGWCGDDAHEYQLSYDTDHRADRSVCDVNRCRRGTLMSSGSEMTFSVQSGDVGWRRMSLERRHRFRKNMFFVLNVNKTLEVQIWI